MFHVCAHMCPNCPRCASRTAPSTSASHPASPLQPFEPSPAPPSCPLPHPPLPHRADAGAPAAATAAAAGAPRVPPPGACGPVSPRAQPACLPAALWATERWHGPGGALPGQRALQHTAQPAAHLPLGRRQPTVRQGKPGPAGMPAARDPQPRTRNTEP